MTDVLVVGGGPAGRALAASCARFGLHTALADPNPGRPWTSTYGAWADELPSGTPVAATAASVRAFALGEHVIDRTYVVLDNAALRALPDEVEVHAGKVVELRDRSVRLADDRELNAALVVDARGAPPGRDRAEQTAAGVIVPSDRTDAVLMDWRDGTFLYAVPLGGGRMLYEETSLARRPGMPLAELRDRLHARLGIEPCAHCVDTMRASTPALCRHNAPEGEERVRFPLDVARPRHLAFGAAAAFVHPATGYSVATSLSLAPRVAAAIADALPGDPRKAAQQVIWPRAAKVVHVMRRRGLEALLRLPPEQVPGFFEIFFTLPAELQRAYLSGRDDVTGTAKAMAALFRRAPWRIRRNLL